MRDQLVALIEAERSGRVETLAQSLRNVRDNYTNRGALGHGRFPVDLDIAAGTELQHRAQRYLAKLKHAAATAAWVWTPSSATVVMEVVNAELARDWEEVQQKERAFSAGRDIRLDALNAALDRAQSCLWAELQLHVQAQERSAIPLLDRLSVPRYEAPLRVWQRARFSFPRAGEDPALAVRDATGAVEELARIVLGKPRIVLGEAIQELRRRKDLHPAALKGLSELWALRSDVPGIGHGASTAPMNVAAARYLLDLAEAALRLLLELDVGLQEPPRRAE